MHFVHSAATLYPHVRGGVFGEKHCGFLRKWARFTPPRLQIINKYTTI